ncbi:MAG: PKD domain-containing protein [Saprospiraceae bacterium]|nr:PKD domain-containing protein [Saprospiraceae bacterium]
MRHLPSTILRAGITLLLALTFLPGLYATHIVGGQIGYRWISGTQFNNTYEIILDVYRDCSNPANEPFDDPAWIGIYNGNNEYVTRIQIPFTSADTLDAILFDDCLSVPDYVCVARTQYRGTVTLSSNPAGGSYRISYVRCCRNETITNIENPLDAGAVFDIVLTQAAIQRQNSSPQFRSWPPIFICVNNPILYDHSAIDTFEVAGVSDSIVYSLCTPLSGGTITTPRPIPNSTEPLTNPANFSSVVWKAPVYDVFNMLGSMGDTTIVTSSCASNDTIISDSLRIHPGTGLLTGTPTIQGQFVVGVCVQEYDRNTGVLLSSTRRDFQYNVGQCNEATASFDAPEVQCDDLTVQFTSTSTNADDFIWYFDFPASTPSSTEQNPLYTFPDTGIYTVTLVAEPLSTCVDTFCQQIYLTTSTLLADYRADVFDCDTFAILQLQDLSVDTSVMITSRKWTVIYNGDTLISTLPNPSFNVPLGVTGTIRFEVTNANACTSVFDTTFTSGLDNPGGFIRADLFACAGDTLSLNPDTDPNIGFDYLWSPSIGLLDPANSVNPRIVAAGPAVYTVTITAPGGVCEIIRTVTVNSSPLPMLDFEAVADCDGLTINFNNTSTGASVYEWSFGDPLNPGAGSTLPNPSYTYSDVGTYLVTLKVPDTELCRDSITREVIVQMKSLSAEFTVEYETCSPDSVIVRFMDASVSTVSPITAWSWDFGNGQTSDQQNPTLTIYSNTDLNVTLTVTAADDCSNTMSKPVNIRLIDPIDFELLPELLVRCEGGSVQLAAPLSTDYLYLWSPADGIDDPTSNNPVFSPAQTTVYTLTVGLVSADTCYYAYSLTVTVPPAIDINVDGAGLTCDAETTLTATASVSVDWEWTNAGGDILSQTNTLTVPVSGVATFTVTATDASGCEASQSVQVSGGPVNVTLPDVAAVCLGEELVIEAINNDPNDILTYLWSPASAFVPGTETTATPDFIETPGELVVTVEISNQYGCDFTGTVQTAVVDTAFQLGFTTLVQCNGATVEFTNTSTDAFAYVWDFGDGTGSTETSPVHTYTTAGSYIVTLTIGYDVSCADTLTATVDITDPQIVALFDYDIAECNNGSAEIAFFDGSINTFNNTNQWNWTFSNGQSSTLQNPVITVTESGDLTVTLTINTANNCPASVTETINIQLINVSIADTVLVCRGDSVPLNPGGNPAYQYLWAPADGLSDATAANPLAFPDQTTLYTVQIQALGGDTCSYVQDVLVLVPDAIGLDIPDDATTCGGPVTLGAGTIVPATVVWTNSLGQNLGGPTITVDPFRVETYTATATDAFGCTESRSVTITDNGVDVTATPSGDVTACEDVAFPIIVTNLDDQDTLTYVWTPAELIVSGAGTATPIAMVGPNGGMITGIITNQFGCTDTVEVNVSIVPFKVEIADTVIICAGEPAGISSGANPNFQYEWSPTTDLDLSNPANPIYIGTTGGVYSVTITDTTGGFFCQTIRTVTVLVTPEIGLTATGDTTVCSLGELELNASATVPVTFSWSEPGQPPFATGSPVSYNVTAAGNYVVQVIATDGFMCSDTAVVNITAADFQPGDLNSPQTICVNTPTPLNPGGNPAYTYTWSPTTGLDLSDPSNPVAVLNSPATYNVTVTDPVSGCSVEQTIEVGVFAPINLQATADTTLCGFGDVTLSASGSVPVTIEWYLNGDLVFTGNSFTVTFDEEGVFTYTAIALDANDCRDTATVTVTAVNFEPGDLGSPQTICGNTPTPLNPGGNPAYTYVWSPTTGLDLSDPSNPVAVLNGPATYNVTVTDPVSGCSVAQTIEVDVFPLINLTASEDTLLCEIAPVTLTATADVSATFTWYLNNFNTPAGTGASITVTPAEGGSNYIVVAEDANGCTDTTTVNISLFIIDTGIQDSIRVCIDAPTPINPGGNPAYTYVWSPLDGLDLNPPHNPTVTTAIDRTYSVTISDPVLGCSIERQIEVRVYPAIDLSVSGETTLCTPDALATLTASSAIAAGFEWADNPLFVPVAGTGATFTVSPPAGSSTYYVRATDDNGCTEVTSVTVNNFPIAAIITPPVVLCVPATTTQIGVVNLDPSQNLTYNWSPANAVTPPSGNPIVTVNATIAQNISVLLTNQFGCEQTLSTTVTILDLPGTVTATATPDEVILGDPSQLDVIGCDDCMFNWTPAESLSASDIRNPVATPDRTTEYTVTVSKDGCSADLRVTVVVNFLCEEPYIFFPSAFTPNGDGENDVLRVRARPPLVLEVNWVIYNRWGQKMFEATNLNDSWDGTFKGKDLPPDVYGFHLIVSCPGGEQFVKKGNVTLLR